MPTPATPRASDRWRFYRAVWRWHFYAGLFVLPFIAWLALTGAVYVYQKPIDRWIHHDLKVVQNAAVPPSPASAQLAAVNAVSHGEIFRYTTPEYADGSIEIGVQEADGRR